MFNRAKPEEVFTPRAAEINSRMYIDRPSLENSLVRALRGTKYIVIHGESGNGKTWLYKRVFSKENFSFQVLNLANVISRGSFDLAFQSKLGELGRSEATSQTNQMGGNVNPFGIGISGQTATTSKIYSTDPFVSLLSELRNKSATKNAALVFDNFEAISDDSNALRTLASIIISADEEVVSRLNVKILIVGVPGDIRSLIAKAGNATTISNRLTEIPEVARMTKHEAKALMKTGLEDQLGIKIEIDRELFYEDLCYLTDRIAQQIHELCLKIAYEAIETGRKITQRVFEEAQKSWAQDTLSADWAVIQSLMNVKTSSAGRKNQVLYALGKCDLEDFKYSDIEKLLRAEFPNSTKDVGLNVAGMLTSFSNSTNPLLRRTPDHDAYRFVSPKLRMAIRTNLKKTLHESVEKTF